MRTHLSIAGVAVALLLAGCGAGEEPAETTATSSTTTASAPVETATADSVKDTWVSDLPDEASALVSSAAAYRAAAAKYAQDKDGKAMEVAAKGLFDASTTAHAAVAAKYPGTLFILKISSVDGGLSTLCGLAPPDQCADEVAKTLTALDNAESELGLKL